MTDTSDTGRKAGRRAGPRTVLERLRSTRTARTETAAASTLTPSKPRALLATAALLAGCVVGAVGVTVAAAPAALAGTVPPPPSGWNTVFSDNFAGAAGSAPSSSNWFYDIGSGYGTGEIENTTSSTNNVYLDGNGDMVLKAIDNGGTWTSARIESTRDDFEAPAGGELEMTASIEQPNPANGLGYWPAFWALGSPMRAGGGWPQSGEIDMMEDVNGLNEASQTLHDSAGSSGSPLTACSGSTSCQTGFHTYSVIVNRVNTSAEYLEFLMDGTVTDTITEASVGTTAWQDAIDHGFFIIFDLAMGGNYPDGVYGSTTPTSATTSGASMSVNYVAVYEEGGNSTPTGTAKATGEVTGDGGQCLTNANSLNTEGNPIEASACNASSGQEWSPYTDGTVRVEGGCLDVVAAGTTAGTDIDWYACNATNAQVWTYESNDELVNPNSGLCLTGGASGAQLELEACTGASDQLWTLPTGTGTSPPPTGDAPFGGTPAAVPGTVQAANYDTGGQGVAYNVTATNGTANTYRSDGVDLEDTADTLDTTAAGGAYDVGWTGTGQWFHYTVNVATAGTYTVGLRVAAPAAVTDALHIDNSAGTNLSGNVNLAATGGYQDWATVNATVTLPAGQQVLTIDQDNAGWNVHYLSFTANSTTTGDAPYGGTPAAVPGTVLAANYDTGGQGVAYNVTSVNGTANSYRSDGVDLEACTDTGCGDDIGWTAAGQWFHYTVNVATAGTYTVALSVAAPAAVTDALHIDNSAGTNLSGNVNIPDTGGYQDWTTVDTTVTLPAGEQTLTLDQDAGGWNIFESAFTESGSSSGSAWYEIVNANSGLCESAAGAGTTTGTAVEQLACTGATSQLWQLVPTSTGLDQVLNENAQSENQSWAITGGNSATASGDLLETSAYTGTSDTSALFTVTKQTSGDYTFVANNSGLCIDTPNASTTSGVQLQQFTCNGTPAQSFSLVQG